MQRPLVLLLPPETFPDREAAEAFGRRLLRFSPRVALWQGMRDPLESPRTIPWELVVDLAPTAHLFQGEETMIAAIVGDPLLRMSRHRSLPAGRLDALGSSGSFVAGPNRPGSYAVADTLAAARLAARRRPGTRLHAAGTGVLLDSGGRASLAGTRREGGGEEDETEFVEALPLQQVLSLPDFRLAPPDRKLLSFLGVATLGDLLKHSARISSALFSPGLQELLLHARRSPRLEARLFEIREETRFEDRICFSPPVSRVSPVLFCLASVLEGLMERGLAPMRLMLTALRLTLVTESMDELSIDVVPAAPTRDARLLLDLCRLKLGALFRESGDIRAPPAKNILAALERPIEECRVSVERHCPEEEAHGDLLRPTVRNHVSLARLAGRLDALLARASAADADPNRALFRFGAADALLPEEKYRVVAATRTPPAAGGGHLPTTWGGGHGGGFLSSAGGGGVPGFAGGGGLRPGRIAHLCKWWPQLGPLRPPRAATSPLRGEADMGVASSPPPRAAPSPLHGEADMGVASSPPPRAAPSPQAGWGDLGLFAEYEFFDPGLSRTVTHRYYRVEDEIGHALLVKRVDEGDLTLVGLFGD